MAVLHSSAFNFKEVVERYLHDYGVSVAEETFEAIDEVSKEAVKKLKAESRASFGGGEYAQGWTRKFDRGRIRGYATVYGKKPTYALAHLLEHGHVTRNGTGRVFRPTPGRTHIAPVAEWAADEAVDRIVSKLEKRL